MSNGDYDFDDYGFASGGDDLIYPNYYPTAESAIPALNLNRLSPSGYGYARGGGGSRGGGRHGQSRGGSHGGSHRGFGSEDYYYEKYGRASFINGIGIWG